MKGVKYLLVLLSMMLGTFFVAASLLTPDGSGGTDGQAAALAGQLGAQVREPLFNLSSTGETFMLTLGGVISGILLYHYWIKTFGAGRDGH